VLPEEALPLVPEWALPLAPDEALPLVPDEALPLVPDGALPLGPDAPDAPEGEPPLMDPVLPANPPEAGGGLLQPAAPNERQVADIENETQRRINIFSKDPACTTPAHKRAGVERRWSFVSTASRFPELTKCGPIVVQGAKGRARGQARGSADTLL